MEKPCLQEPLVPLVDSHVGNGLRGCHLHCDAVVVQEVLQQRQATDITQVVLGSEEQRAPDFAHCVRSTLTELDVWALTIGPLVTPAPREPVHAVQHFTVRFSSAARGT